MKFKGLLGDLSTQYSGRTDMSSQFSKLIAVAVSHLKFLAYPEVKNKSISPPVRLRYDVVSAILCFVVLFGVFFPCGSQCEIRTFSDHTGQWRLEEYITTHFTRLGGDNSMGGEREVGYFNPYYGYDADLSWMNMDKDGHPWNNNIKPSYNNYNNTVTSFNSINTFYDNNFNNISDKIEYYQHSLFSKTGYHCDILNYNPNIPVESYLTQNNNNIQIINNIIYGNSLFTITFPPFWTKNPQNRYPILLSCQGYGTDNNDIYLNTNLEDAIYVSQSAKLGKGLIAIRSNCGGRESLGINENALRDIGGFLTDVMPRYGADIHRIISRGASRGGGVALVWGANPYQYDYNVQAIYAFVPPVKIGSMVKLSYATFPALIGPANSLLGTQTAFLNYYKDEDNGERLKVDAEPSAIIDAALGVKYHDEADEKSPYGYYAMPYLTESLQSKRLLISQSTHDSFMPVAHFIDFDNSLSKQGIPHATILGYGGYGHNFSENNGDLDRAITDLFQGKGILPNDGGRIFFMPEKLMNTGEGTRADKPIKITDSLIAKLRESRPGYFDSDHNATKLAFSASIPYRVGKGTPITVTLIGESGKAWEVRCRREDGYYSIHRASGVFGNSLNSPIEQDYGKEFVILTLKAAVEPGRYEWFFVYNGREIPNRFTPFISKDGVYAKAITEVTNEIPREYYSKGTGYYHPYSYDMKVNFGVDQYHPLLFPKNNSPVLETVYNISIAAGQKINFQIRAHDPDGDPLVFDVLDNSTNDLIKGIHFNGLTGEFICQTSEKDKGEYRLKAIVKDGKGGISTQNFIIWVR